MVNFKQYQDDALRTCKVMEANVYNSIHMVLGITSEYLETKEALEIVNNFTGAVDEHILLTEGLKKEVGDVLWYVALLAKFNNLDFSRGHGFMPMTIDKAVETLNSVYKANWIYDRAMMAPDKTGYTLEQQVQWAIYNIILWIESTFPFKLQDIMDVNIAKLKERFPDKFEADLANNRKEDTRL